MLKIVPLSVKAATFIKESTVLNFLSVSETIFLQSSSFSKSAWTYRHSAPMLSISDFTLFPFSLFLPQIVIPLAPLFASYFAVSAPLPWVLPVTMIILFLNWLDCSDIYLLDMLKFYIYYFTTFKGFICCISYNQSVSSILKSY